MSEKWLASGAEGEWRDLQEIGVFGELAVRAGFALAVELGFIRIRGERVSSQYVEQQMGVRGIRGAITVSEDTPDQIRGAAKELMEEILKRNGITNFDDVISAVFTTTQDLISAFPAEAARALGDEFCSAVVCSGDSGSRLDGSLSANFAAREYGVVSAGH